MTTLDFHNTIPEKAAIALHTNQANGFKEVRDEATQAFSLTEQRIEMVLEQVADKIKEIGPKFKVLTDERIEKFTQAIRPEAEAGPTAGQRAGK